MRYFIALVLTLVAVSSNAAILCQSPNGSVPYAPPTLAAAVASPSCRNTSVVVTTALSAVQSNISSATVHSWPADRALEVRAGGSINPTTTFTGLPYATPEMFGGAADGVTENLTAINKALTAGGGHIKLRKGTYKITDGAIAYHNTTSIWIDAEPGTIIDDSASATPSTILIRLGGSTGDAGTLSASVSAGTRTLTTSLPMAPGDIFMLESTDNWKGTVPKGEMGEVLAVSGTTITLRTSLYDSYNSANTTITKINTSKVRIDNLFVRRDPTYTSGFGVMVEYGKQVHISNCATQGTTERGMYVAYSLYGDITGNRFSAETSALTGTNYGLSLASVQSLKVTNNVLYGGRHGLMHGGWWPNRDIYISGNTISNYPSSSTVYALDFHPNSEHVKVVNNTVYNGILTTAPNIEFLGNTVTNTIPSGGFNYGIRAFLDFDCDYMVIKGNRVSAKATTSDTAIEVTGTSTSGVTYGKVVISDNEVEGWRGISLKPYASGTALTVTDLFVENNKVSSTSYAFSILPSGAQLPTITSAYVRGGKYKSTTAYTAFIKGTGTFLDIDGAEFYTTAAGNTFLMDTGSVVTTVSLRNNTFRGDGSGTGAYIDNTGELYTINNIGVGLTIPIATISAAVTRTVSGTYGKGNVVTTGTAAPAALTWAVGDRRINSSPTVGQPKAWVCTVAGTPGTWVSEGNL